MAENGIIFSDALANAIRAGSKTQTRRLVWSAPLGAARPRATEWSRLAIGDRLWVRQQWARLETPTPHYVYAADGRRPGVQWMPARWMPRTACRCWLEVTDLRKQHLQDIPEDDCLAEGIQRGALGFGLPPFANSWRPTPREAFAAMWDRLHDHHDAAWAKNPRVIAITFRLLETAP